MVVLKYANVYFQIFILLKTTRGKERKVMTFCLFDKARDQK